jgi:Bifunctional DNA primase/polymerase, N-terminal/Primase C terminal 1 (PriCT-1)
MTAQLELALRYVRSGLAVLPLHWPVRHERSYRCSCGRRDCTSPAKHPFGRLVRKGLQDASKDPAVIARWFGQGRLNIGIATGALSGIIALDVDPRHDGDQTLAEIEREHGPLPATWRFLTGGGGEHILFRHPGNAIPNSAAKLGPGVDVRGDGGYIVAPPSEHISGRPYAISVDHHPDEVQLADPPVWLLQRLRPQPQTGKPAARPARDWRSVVGSEVVEGERNRTLASLSGHLLRNRIDPWVALNLLQSWNRAQCRPPLADAEVVATVRSIARREIARREGRHAR